MPVPSLQERARALARRLAISESRRFSHWVLPLYRPRPAARGNAALVGDSLSTADLFVVEGIASGVTSSELLVRSFDQRQDSSFYSSDLSHHPCFRSMRSLDLLKRSGGIDVEEAHRAACKPCPFEHRVRLLLSASGERSLSWLFAVRHTLRALQARDSLGALPQGLAASTWSAAA